MLRNIMDKLTKLQHIKAVYENQIRAVEGHIRKLEDHKFKVNANMEKHVMQLEKNLKNVKDKKWRFDQQISTNIRNLKHRKMQLEARARG